MISITPREAMINNLMSCYTKTTGIPLNHRGVCNPWAPMFSAFIDAGYTEKDLEFVITHLRGQIRDEKRNWGILKIDNLLGDIFRFEQELGLARAQTRNARPAPTGKDRAVAQLRPEAAPPKPSTRTQDARPISFYIDQMRKAVNNDNN